MSASGSPVSAPRKQDTPSLAAATKAQVFLVELMCPQTTNESRNEIEFIHRCESSRDPRWIRKVDASVFVHRHLNYADDAVNVRYSDVHGNMYYRGEPCFRISCNCMFHGRRNHLHGRQLLLKIFFKFRQKFIELTRQALLKHGSAVRHGFVSAVRHGFVSAVRHGSVSAVRHGFVSAVRHGSVSAVRRGSVSAVRHGSVSEMTRCSMMHVARHIADLRHVDRFFLTRDFSSYIPR